MQTYDGIFGFLFNSKKLTSLRNKELKNYCVKLETTLRNDESCDVDASDLFSELQVLQYLLPSTVNTTLEIIEFVKDMDCFPNILIAYRILLTVPVTVASAERSFSKLKLLKSYLRSTMSQERLNGLVILSIENEMLEKLEFENIIEDFASQNARKLFR